MKALGNFVPKGDRYCTARRHCEMRGELRRKKKRPAGPGAIGFLFLVCKLGFLKPGLCGRLFSWETYGGLS